MNFTCDFCEDASGLIGVHSFVDFTRFVKGTNESSMKYVCYIYCVVLIFTYFTGIEVEMPIGVMHSRAILLLGSMDLPARAIVANMKHFNGKYGCLYCLNAGQTAPGNHLHRFWPNLPATTELRIEASILDDAKLANLQGEAVSDLT